MNIENLINYLEDWAPPGAGWEKDNNGIQVGSREKKINNILLSLELTPNVLNQAIKQNCNFIFTHHPFIFSPLKKIDTTNDLKSKLIRKLIKNDITLYSAHTNLDFTKEGVSFQLARRLGLKDIDFLKREESNQFKVAVYVPQNDLKKVSQAAYNAGGGIIGEYSNCGQFIDITGTFKGSEESNPAIGEKSRYEEVDEIRFELLVYQWKLNEVISAIIKAHPYEEPAYDIFPLKNKNVNYGSGALGYLKNRMTEKTFLKYVNEKLKIRTVKYCKGAGRKIKKVAVCGGSGSELINIAINSGADAFITADIKYHPFQDAENKILLIDAGHYETEIVILDEVKRKLEKFISNSGRNIKVYKYRGSTNPIRIYNYL